MGLIKNRIKRGKLCNHMMSCFQSTDSTHDEMIDCVPGILVHLDGGCEYRGVAWKHDPIILDNNKVVLEVLEELDTDEVSVRECKNP